LKQRPYRKRPLIGITPDVTTARTSSRKRGEPTLLLIERYARAIAGAGGIPLILVPASSRRATRETAKFLDGILVTGGNFDIHPSRYGEASREDLLGEVKEDRTEFELELISWALERDLPLLGVCGGEQAINVALGGSLYQDIATQIPRASEHQKGAWKERGGHPVRIHDGTKLREIVGRDTVEVNTTHHQAVKKLGQGLTVNATAEDGVIEGIESKDHSFILGVQWHPEFLTHKDPFQRKIFAAFIAACKKA